MTSNSHMTHRESNDSRFAQFIDTVMIFGPTGLAALTVFPSFDTPTESIVVAVLASLFVGVLVHGASGLAYWLIGGVFAHARAGRLGKNSVADEAENFKVMDGAMNQLSPGLHAAAWLGVLVWIWGYTRGG